MVPRTWQTGQCLRTAPLLAQGEIRDQSILGHLEGIVHCHFSPLLAVACIAVLTTALQGMQWPSGLKRDVSTACSLCLPVQLQALSEGLAGPLKELHPASVAVVFLPQEQA